ncbi:MAG TPA: alpha/beta hydrolase [Galbitalea sp.]
MTLIEASDHEDIYVPHAFAEHLVDLGEVRLNYAVAGDADKPALLLIPGQSESWWGYEEAMKLLSDRYQLFAVDLRGQGRSTWTPGRYTLDNIAGDLVRFLDVVVGRPAFVSGLSSGGVLATWLAAYAKPGQVLGVIIEDAPLFASETNPAIGQSFWQAIGPLIALQARRLGDQWSIGDVAGLNAAFAKELPAALLRIASKMRAGQPHMTSVGVPQNILEYDPEWGRSFASGLVAAGCDHLIMVQQVKVPALYTHHFREIDEETGRLLGAVSDLQVAAVGRAIEAAGNSFTYRSFPDMPHSMHGADPALYASVVDEWLGGFAANFS